MGALPLGAWPLSRAGALAGNTAAVAGPGREEEVLAGNLARAAATLGLYAWHPHPPFLPSLHRSGYPEPRRFLEAAPTMTPRGGEGALPGPDHHSHPNSSYVPLGCVPLIWGTQSLH